jgi:hypothetical protein
MAQEAEIEGLPSLSAVLLQSYRRGAANLTPPYQAATANSDAMNVRCASISLAGIVVT